MERYTKQRIRDPLHNIIEFQDNQFENVIWRLIDSAPFQRLRRVKQLGFSSFVYPGASHTRFAHSIGVFHTARKLMKIVESHLGERRSWQPERANQALAASLLHDVGHGPFSHAFEDVGKRLKLEMAKHEKVSKALILDSEITPILKELGSGFPQDVSDVIDETIPPTIYSAVVSSQFDADRLDYMRRDKLMCGTDHGAIDFDWLLANIEIGVMPDGVDDQATGEVSTFVLGPKAFFAAEAYVLGLFHLYPTVYFHKTTRSAEKLFSELLCQIFKLSIDGSYSKTGLPKNHPLIQFALNPSSLSHSQALDDEVIFGALSQTVLAKDNLISQFSQRLRKRHFYKAFDLRRNALNFHFSGEYDRKDVALKVNAICEMIEPKILKWNAENSTKVPRILLDKGSRSPYKRLSESKSPVNQILIRGNSRAPEDLRKHSEFVKIQEPFRFCRAYVDESDKEALTFLENEIKNCNLGTN